MSKKEIIDQDKIIDKQTDYKVTIEKSGLYLIEITARARSRRQIHRFKQTDDEELTVRIDDLNFFQTAAKWNGNDLKNLQKTIVFVFYLNKGDHTIRLIPRQKPFLNLLKVFSIENGTIDYLPDANNPAQEGDRRPWYSYIIVNLGLKKISIQAKAKKHFFSFDDDDLKIIINKEIFYNDSPKSHSHWFWCGKILRGRSREFLQSLDPSIGTHIIELYADRTPLLEKVVLGIEPIITPPPPPAKRLPTRDDPQWTGDFNDDTGELILARVIFGEARGISKKAKAAVAWTVRNRMNDRYHRWATTYHGVILQPKQYSAFNEGDENLPYVKNPFYLGLSLDKKRWLESYEIAQKVIEGEIKDPTDGANHYYSDYINPPDWTKKREAKFKIKIDNMHFYNLKNDENSGKIKLSLLILLGSFLFIMILLPVTNIFFADKECSECTTNKFSVVRDKYYFIHPIWKELAVIDLGQDGEFINMRKLTDNGYAKSHLSVFSERDLLGYFQRLQKPGEKEDYDNSIALMIMKGGEKPYEIYRGDYHTSDWEWFSYYQVRLIYSCGSGCHLVKTINIETKEVEAEDVVYYKSYDNQQE